MGQVKRSAKKQETAFAVVKDVYAVYVPLSINSPGEGSAMDLAQVVRKECDHAQVSGENTEEITDA